MIGLLRKFQFHFLSFLLGTIPFLRRYIRSRPMSGMLPAAFAVLSSLSLIVLFVWAGRDSYRQSMLADYRQLTEQAVSNGDPGAEVYFTKLLQLSDDPQAESFRFAKQLYEESKHRDDLSPHLLETQAQAGRTSAPLLRRALMIMNSLAPRRRGVASFPPAHKFLAEYWRTRQPQTDVIQVLAMQHDVFAAPREIKPAIALARKLQSHNYHTVVIETLKSHRQNSEALLLLAASHSRAGDLRSANQCLQEAEDRLRNQLSNSPDDTAVRLDLSRCIAAQNRILESMFVLLEGYSSDASPKLVDQLIQHYTIWLQLMAHDKAMMQLADIELALKYAPNVSLATDERATDEFAELQLSTGERFKLPTSIVRLHTALMNGEGEFLPALLLGTEKVIRKEYKPALLLLEKAHQGAPEHPVIANNLAWTLLKKLEADTSLDPSSHAGEDEETVRILDRAFALSSSTVTTCPDVMPFRATKGIIAAQMSNWAIAVQELQHCVDSGDASAEVRRQLILAKRKLQRPTPL